MSVFCPGCGREYDITLFSWGRTIECACGTRVGREMKILAGGEEPRPREIRFVADVMLGRLARWLRIIGSDTLYFAGIADADLVRISIEEKRVLLTRDRALPGEWWVDTCFLIETDDPMDQLRQVVERFALPWRERLFTRCTLCNETLEAVAAETVLADIPEMVAAGTDSFTRCFACGRVYWAGSHVERMRQRLEEVLGSARDGRPLDYSSGDCPEDPSE
jgi:uncharacterized protein with PIN domain